MSEEREPIQKLKKKKPKRVTRDYADKLMSKYIRLRDGACRRCGSTTDLQNAHIRSRRYALTRFDPDNCLCLCRSCHFWQTNNPLEGDDFFIETIGVELFEDLRRRAMTRGKIEYRALCAWLNEAIRELEAEA